MKNAYKVNLTWDYGLSATFNVGDLSPHLEDDHLANLRSSSSNKVRMMEVHLWDMKRALKTNKKPKPKHQRPQN